VLVAERLLQLGIDAETHTGEALKLIEVWSGDEDVVVVDAVVTGAPAGAVQLWDGCQVTVPRGLAASTHGFSVVEAIELARVLRRLPERLRVYGIEGRQFDLGSDISPEVKQTVENVARQIASRKIGHDLGMTTCK
jgi:hydrogenase maturation protease